MEWRHDVEAKDLETAFKAEISEALVVQEREIEMEDHVRSAELKAMQKRRMLNSLREIVDDSSLFTYISKEVLDNNTSIRNIMPSQFAVANAEYLERLEESYLMKSLVKAVQRSCAARSERDLSAVTKR
jgi:hypothetical protein